MELLPQLWLCEISEMGVSLCGVDVELRNTSLINAMLTTDQAEIDGVWAGKKKFADRISKSFSSSRSKFLTEADVKYLDVTVDFEKVL